MSVEHRSLRLTAARPEHAEAYWRINNHPSVRAVGFTPGDIPWDSHLKWFEAALTNEDMSLYVVLQENTVIAVLRFQLVRLGTSEVSIAVGEGLRGAGVGQWTLSNGCEEHFQSDPRVGSIRAYVRSENVASRRLFEKAGFWEVKELQIKGFSTTEYRRDRG